MILETDADAQKSFIKQKRYLKFRIVKRAIYALLLLALYLYFKPRDESGGAAIFLALAIVYAVVLIEQIYELYKLTHQMARK